MINSNVGSEEGTESNLILINDLQIYPIIV